MMVIQDGGEDSSRSDETNDDIKNFDHQEL
jgi:hypothetical protein